MANSLDHYWNAYEAIKSWIIFSDTKAGAIIAFYAVLGSALLPHFSNIKTQIHSSSPLAILWFLVLALSVCSIICAFVCLYPQKRVAPSNSLIFYRDITEHYPSVTKYSFDCQKSLSNDFFCINDISGQVWALSKVATKKYNFTTNAIRFLLISMVPSALLLIFNFL